MDTMELMRIQGNEETVTPTEALDVLRAQGLRPPSRRTLSFWQEQGVVPSALRVGARGGVYPAIIVPLLAWVTRFKNRGVALETIKELHTVWAYLMRGVTDRQVGLVEFEQVCRAAGLSDSANYLVPDLVREVVADICPDCRSSIAWVCKDGSTVQHTAKTTISLKFVIAEVEPATGGVVPLAWTQLVLPGLGDEVDLFDRSTVVLGLPLGFEMGPASRRHRGRRHRAQRCDVKPKSPQDMPMLAL